MDDAALVGRHRLQRDRPPVARHLPRHALGQPHQRFLTPRAVALDIDDDAHPLVQLTVDQQVHQVLHLGEVLAARWDAIDMERGLWTFRTKGDKPHVLGLPTQALSVLREAWALSSHTPWVCPGPGLKAAMWSPQKAALRVRTRSGVNFRIHDIRRTVASGLGELGIEEGLISRILNHSTRSTSGATVTAQVYNQFKYVEPMRKALQAWCDQLDAIVSAQPAEVVSIRAGRK